MAKRVTLADIARESSVSVATVSMVLRNRAAAIPPETRQRIRETARSLGYAPRSPRPPRPHAVDTLGVILKGHGAQPLRENPFYSGILAGIDELCRRRHMNLLYSALPVDSDNCPLEYPRLLSNGAIQGLIVVGVRVTAPLQRVLDELDVPVAMADGYADAGGYDAAVSDNRDGVRQAIAHLAAHGHRHIGMVIAESGGYPSIAERRQGYLEALHAHGLAESYIADSSSAPDRLELDVGALLRAHPQITALFGANDLTVLAAAHAARALGRRVPEDLSLVGFDDIELAQHVSPPLTTLHVDTHAMGRLAVQLLIHRLEHPGADRVTAVLRPHLVERQSVAAAPAGPHGPAALPTQTPEPSSVPAA